MSMGEIERGFASRAAEVRRRLFDGPPKAKPLPMVRTAKPIPKLVTAADRIISEVCAKHRVTVPDLMSRRGPLNLADARAEAAFRLVVECGKSQPQAGKILGGRDHTTALALVRRHCATHPEAAVHYAAWKVRAEEDRTRLMQEAFVLHFDQGLSVRDTADVLRQGDGKVGSWLHAEKKRRAGVGVL